VGVGTRVSFRGFGTWAEYCTAQVSHVMPLPANTQWENAAGALVNPLTAYTLIQLAKERGARMMALTAAGSGLGRMLTRYGVAEGVGTCAIVRRADLVEGCLEEGALIALDSSDPNYQANLQKVCEEHGVKLAFDAVAGPEGGQLLNSLANGGKMYVYGGLSGRPLDGVAWSQLIFKGKSLEGFWMTQEMQSQLATPSGAARLQRNMKTVGEMLETHLRTIVSRTFSLEDTAEALVYMRKNMSWGKVQLKIQDD